jgi:hypothetical protein
MDEFHGRTWDPGSDLSPHQTELATSLRVPILTSPHPRWHYVVGIVVDPLWFGTVPSDAEVRAIASFADEYRQRWYNPTWVARMARFAPFDIDGGANSTWFFRYEHGGWAYQKRTWRHGARPRLQDEPMNLTAVMDRCRDYGSKPNPTWEAWKAEHGEVFAAVAGVEGGARR